MSPAPLATDDVIPATRRTIRISDIDAFAQGQQGWRLECEQISSGSFEGLLDHVQLPQLRLVREITNRAMRQHGEMSAGSCGFALAHSPRLDEARFSGQRLRADSVMIGHCDELDLCSPPGFELTGIVVDSRLLKTLGDSVTGPVVPTWLNQRIVLHYPEPAMAAVRATLAHAFDAIDQNAAILSDPRLATHLRDDVLFAWLRTIPPSVDMAELKSAQARCNVVRRARDAVLNRPDEPMSMLEICKYIGASPRKLHYCFHETLGLSPARYLRLLRLNEVRRSLLRPDGKTPRVQDIAARWGFWHLSQFALDYKRQFGELPSQTLHGRHAVNHGPA